MCQLLLLLFYYLNVLFCYKIHSAKREAEGELKHMLMNQSVQNKS